MNDVENMTGEELVNEVETEAAADEAAAKPVTMGIGQFAKHLILNTAKTNDQILETIRKVFPAANTSMASIAWYRSDLRKKGLLGPKSGKTTVTLTAEELEALTK